ncbi:MAG: glycosyltransferase [Lentisphaerae bacterium]|nr:glycosyltransferase [Lentisphaerota bacterium]
MTYEATIIIPTYNRGELIKKCLSAILPQKTSRKFQVIVVDDGSSDNTAEIVNSYSEVLLVQQPNSGPGKARNNGAYHARSEILVFTDDDCIPEPNWLDELLKPFEDNDIAGVKGAYLSTQKQLTAQFVQFEYEEKFDCLKKCKYIDLIDTYSAAFRREVFLKNGGYDTTFPVPCVEDREFSMRLSSMNYKLVFCDSAKVKHKHIDSPTEYLRKKIKNGYWTFYLILKLKNKPKSTSDTPKSQFIQIGLIAIMPFSLLFPIIHKLGWVEIFSVFFLFFLSCLPLSFRIFKRNKTLGLTSFFFLLLRALGLTLGIAKGMIDFSILKMKSS